VAFALQGESVDIADLKEILGILEEQDITEFELEQDGVKLRVCRSGAGRGTVSGSSANVGGMVLEAHGGEGGTVVRAAPAPAPASVPESGPGGLVVTSPIVGTFYRAPDPNSPPFVNVGDHIKVGQVLCIIEAMKLMNEIEAEAAGEILKIHVENGQAVQYGDALFTVKPA
jgi:acetyl-CoA carboxylase biotin carboxyl carrier protein